MNTQNIQKVIDFLNSQKIDIDFDYHLKNEDFANADEIENILDDANAFDVEIIYYSRAIEYLQKNDPSLRESLGIAAEMGYEPNNLNSEILASILASQNTRQDFYDIKEELDDLITELLTQEEAEEEQEIMKEATA